MDGIVIPVSRGDSLKLLSSSGTHVESSYCGMSPQVPGLIKKYLRSGKVQTITEYFRPGDVGSLHRTGCIFPLGVQRNICM